MSRKSSMCRYDLRENDNKLCPTNAHVALQPHIKWKINIIPCYTTWFDNMHYRFLHLHLFILVAKSAIAKPDEYKYWHSGSEQFYFLVYFCHLVVTSWLPINSMENNNCSTKLSTHLFNTWKQLSCLDHIFHPLFSCSLSPNDLFPKCFGFKKRLFPGFCARWIRLIKSICGCDSFDQILISYYLYTEDVKRMHKHFKPVTVCDSYLSWYLHCLF